MSNEEKELEEARRKSNNMMDLLGIVDVLEDLFGEEGEEEEEEASAAREDEPDIRLVGVEFQWDDSDPSYSGIPLQSIGTGWQPEDRIPVAYSIEATREAIQKGKLKIWARFHSDEGKGKIQVRTRNQNVDRHDILTQKVIEQELGRNILGNVPVTTVFFNDSGYSVFRGKHTFVPMTLENPLFPQRGVGIYDFNWKWQYRTEDEEATRENDGKIVWKKKWHTIRTLNGNAPIKYSDEFELTKHRVYVTLGLPGAPWTTARIPDVSRGIPVSMPMWAHGLEVACRWATGATQTEDAAKMIADQFFHSDMFKYHPSPKYVSLQKRDPDFAGIELKERDGAYIAYFQFDKLLERLRGGHGLGEKVNCFDTAMSVAALANMLGCQLRVGKLQNEADIDSEDSDHYIDNRFEINPIRAIGYDSHEEVIGGVNDGDRSFFSYHTVAFAPAPGASGKEEDFLNPECRIYDASTELLFEKRYYSISGVPLGDGKTPQTYINYLAAATEDGRPRCKPQPITVVDVQIVG